MHVLLNACVRKHTWWHNSAWVITGQNASTQRMHTYMHACRTVSLDDKSKAGNRASLSNKADRSWNTLIKYSYDGRCSTLCTRTSSVSRRHQEHSLSSAKVGAVPIFILVAEQPSCSRKLSFCEKASLRSRGYKYLFPSFLLFDSHYCVIRS